MRNIIKQTEKSDAHNSYFSSLCGVNRHCFVWLYNSVKSVKRHCDQQQGAGQYCPEVEKHRHRAVPEGSGRNVDIQHWSQVHR